MDTIVEGGERGGFLFGLDKGLGLGLRLGLRLGLGFITCTGLVVEFSLKLRF